MPTCSTAGNSPAVPMTRHWWPGCGPNRGALTREEWRVAEIRAEMVANVWKVVAAEGEQVEDGATLVILESMKMEIPVLTEAQGTVTTLAVAEGDVVQEGDLIAIVECPPRPRAPRRPSAPRPSGPRPV